MMIFSCELLFRSQTAMLGASGVADEKIKRLDEEVHDLKLLKGEIMNAKSTTMCERDANQKRGKELKELNRISHH